MTQDTFLFKQMTHITHLKLEELRTRFLFFLSFFIWQWEGFREKHKPIVPCYKVAVGLILLPRRYAD